MLQRSSSDANTSQVILNDRYVPAHASAIDLREIVRILRRHARIVIASTAILVVLALLFVVLVTPQYTATSSVLIDPRRANVLDSNNQVLTNFGTDDATIESQVSLLQSVAVLQRVVENLKLTSDPEFAPPPGVLDSVRALFSRKPAGGAGVEDVAKARAMETLDRRLKIIRQRATFIVDVNASSYERDKAARIANAVTQAYFLEQVHSKYDATKTAANWLNDQLEDLKARVIASDKAVQDFRAANNLNVAQGVTVNDQQISDLNNKLIEARAESAETRAKYEQVDQIAKSGGDAGSVAEALGSDMISRLRTQYAELAKTEADLSTKFGPRHPQLETVRAQLRETRKLIGEEIRRILQARGHTYDVAVARENSLQKSLDGLQNVSSESGQAQVRLRELQRQAEANRTLYESFLARYKETSAQESLEMPDSRIVTKAEAPITPSFPKIPLTLGLAFAIGLGLGCLLALVADYLDRRIKTNDQARAASGLPSIAAVPAVNVREIARLAKRGRKALDGYDPTTARLLPPALQPPLLRYAVEHPTSAFAEAIRSVRFALQRSARDKTTQVIMVTSAVDGEGKTTLAANLGLSMASLGVKTILVDGDLRNSELTRSMCPRARAGLLDVALAKMPLHQAVLMDQGGNLAILPSPTPSDISVLTEFASSDGMSSILQELRNYFDAIIVDAPPLLPLIDGRALAEQSDCVIFAIGWDQTPSEVVARAVELLAPIHGCVLGTVLTRVDLGRLRFYEPYGSSTYGSSYPYGGPPFQEAAE
jgi:succinoglycan biosynthesis transport protein ExoP